MRNVLIQSELNDNSTCDVLNWIKNLNQKIRVEIVNDDYLIENIKIELSNKKNIEIEINDKYLINTSTFFWYRRGEFISSKESKSMLKKKN